MFDQIGAQHIGEGGTLTSSLGPILQAAGELAQGGIAMYEKNQADKQNKADEERKLTAAQRAFQVAASAMAKATLAAQLKSPSAAGDAAAADALRGSAQRAASALSSAGQAELGRRADASLAAASQAAGAAPKDPHKAATQAAWIALANQIHAGAIVTSGKTDVVAADSGESIWSRPVVGPVKVWHVGAFGAASLGALLLRKLL